MFVFCEQLICRTLMPVQDAQAAPGVSARDNPGEEDDGAGVGAATGACCCPGGYKTPRRARFFISALTPKRQGGAWSLVATRL